LALSITLYLLNKSSAERLASLEEKHWQSLGQRWSLMSFSDVQRCKHTSVFNDQMVTM